MTILSLYKINLKSKQFIVGHGLVKHRFRNPMKYTIDSDNNILAADKRSNLKNIRKTLRRRAR